MAGIVDAGETFQAAVLRLAPLCEHLCRRWAFKMGGDQLCCSVRDGEDYPHEGMDGLVGSTRINDKSLAAVLKAYNYTDGDMCEAADLSIDKVCEWTPRYEGTTTARVIETVSALSLDDCRRQCCEHGAACKAVAFKAADTAAMLPPNARTAHASDGNRECSLLAEFYDTRDSRKRAGYTPNGGWHCSNKWNGPLNPTCKMCIDSMPDLDARCMGCKQHGMADDCKRCWEGFSSLGPTCTACYHQLPQFWPPTHLPTE
eukprot:gene36579-9098_t